ncbi:TCF3 fusion partner like protein [Myotis davidii]|uniref:TCF3 fusion partner like protein n=1 Tax=Myotis davidii TaxID=225400 RepID=L5M606_MYODS|nr:TCF3 fusion partner like protein [Myotis davidii]
MRVLDSYGDDYQASQFTILLEDEGSQGTDTPTPGNAENKPPKKRGCLRPGGCQHPQKPAARPLVRGPVVGRGGKCHWKGAGQESH